MATEALRACKRLQQKSIPQSDATTHTCARCAIVFEAQTTVKDHIAKNQELPLFLDESLNSLYFVLCQKHTVCQPEFALNEHAVASHSWNEVSARCCADYGFPDDCSAGWRHRLPKICDGHRLLLFLPAPHTL